MKLYRVYHWVAPEEGKPGVTDFAGEWRVSCPLSKDAAIARVQEHLANGQVAHYERADTLTRIGMPEGPPPEQQLRAVRAAAIRQVVRVG